MCRQTLENKINELQQTIQRMKQTQKESHKRFYTNKFKITKDMTDEEKEIIQRNIDRRNMLARARYKKNSETAEKQRKRAREAYHRKKELKKKNNTADNTA